MVSRNRDNGGNERIAVMETDIKYIKQKMDEMHKDQQEFIESFNTRFENHEKASDEKYASKLTEKITYGLVGMVLMAFTYGLIALVFIK